MITRTRALLAAAVLLALLALLAVTRSSGASDFLIQTEPPAGSTVASAPYQLLLTFDRPLAQLTNAHHVEVTDASGQRVDDGHADISTYSLRTLVVPLHAKDDGELHVRYSVLLSGDGEHLQVQSSYAFRIDHTLEGEAGEAVEAPATAKSGQALVLWTIVILLGTAAVGGMLYFLRMATGNSRSSLDPTNRTPFRE